MSFNMLCSLFPIEICDCCYLHEHGVQERVSVFVVHKRNHSVRLLKTVKDSLAP